MYKFFTILRLFNPFTLFPKKYFLLSMFNYSFYQLDVFYLLVSCKSLLNIYFFYIDHFCENFFTSLGYHSFLTYCHSMIKTESLIVPNFLILRSRLFSHQISRRNKQRSPLQSMMTVVINFPLSHIVLEILYTCINRKFRLEVGKKYSKCL